MNLNRCKPGKSLPVVVLFGLVLLLGSGGGCDRKEAAAPDPHADHSHAQTTSVHTHANAGETCFICDPGKRETDRLWCREHGRYEDRCWLCHPELEDKDRPFCTVHFLYKDECHLCHPELGTSTQGNAASSTEALFCSEHGVPEIECGICQPQLAAGLQPGESLKVRLPSAASAGKAGLCVGQPQPGDGRTGIRTYCETSYNQNTLARITPLVDGVVRRVYHDAGDRVQTGDILVELHSAGVAAIKSDYLSARVTCDIRDQTCRREKKLFEENIGAEKSYLEAEAACRMARLTVSNLRQKLLNIGLNDDEIDRIEQTEDASAVVAIRAPFGGTLVERTAVAGEAVGPGDAMFTLADLSMMWLKVSIPADRIAGVKVGQTVEAAFREFPNRTFSGQLSWVDTAVDQRSRMINARAELSENLDGLKVGMFGYARIIARRNEDTLLIPRNALQRYEQEAFVFIRQEADLFALRRVQAGSLNGDSVEILSGLKPHDQVVTTGSAVVMSEFLKSRLGAGCAHE